MKKLKFSPKKELRGNNREYSLPMIVTFASMEGNKSNLCQKAREK